MPKISAAKRNNDCAGCGLGLGGGWGVLTGESNHVLGDGEGSSPGSRPCPCAISSSKQKSFLGQSPQNLSLLGLVLKYKFFWSASHIGSYHCDIYRF